MFRRSEPPPLRWEPAQPAAQPADPGQPESLRRIAERLGALPHETRLFVAGYAYVLARIAHADLEVSDAEHRYMERALIDVGHLPAPEASLVIEVARHMAELYGATQDYVATRELARVASREQREDLLRTAFAVSAIDEGISATEVAELNQLGKELGFRADEIDAIRDEHREELSAIRAMRRAGVDEG